MPSEFRLRFEGRSVLAFPDGLREPPGEFRTANCPAHLVRESTGGGRKNGETNLDSRDADDLRLSGDIDGATHVGASGIRQHYRYSDRSTGSGGRECQGDRYRPT